MFIYIHESQKKAKVRREIVCKGGKNEVTITGIRKVSTN